MRRLVAVIVVLIACAGAAAAFAVVALDSDRVDLPGVERKDARRVVDRVRGQDRVPEIRQARCPEGLSGCRSVTGRVIYVESVDPDGDGDLHVVIAAGGVTAPGVTAVDI